MLKSVCGLAIAALIGLSCGANAQELTEEQQTLATQFAINNADFVVQHEIGHLLIGEFELPVLGKEEDAADSLAAVMLLLRETEDADQALIDSADGWYLTEFASESPDYENADFYDSHSLSIQRSFQIVCLMVGARPDTFGEVADQYEMDADRQEECAADFEQAMNSWGGLLEPLEGAGAPIEIIYDDGGADYADIAQMLRDANFLETAAESVGSVYALPRPLTFRGSVCGEENAFYSFEDAQITFCYEMIPFYFRLIADDMLANPT